MTNFFMLKLDSVLPEVHVTQPPDITTITGTEGADTCRFAFTVYQIFTEYRVKVVPYPDAPEPLGIQIESQAGSVNMRGVNPDGYLPETEVFCVLKGPDLQAASAADGEKFLKVFAKTPIGNWSVD
jgi:hypothetical protein